MRVCDSWKLQMDAVEVDRDQDKWKDQQRGTLDSGLGGKQTAYKMIHIQEVYMVLGNYSQLNYLACSEQVRLLVDSPQSVCSQADYIGF